MSKAQMRGKEYIAKRLACDYLEEVGKYLNDKWTSPSAGQSADERLMRAVEETDGITEMGADDFRRDVAGYVSMMYARLGADERTMPPKVLKMCEKFVEKTRASLPERLRTNPKFVVEIDDEQGND